MIGGTILSYVFVLVIPQSILVGKIFKELGTSGPAGGLGIAMARFWKDMRAPEERENRSLAPLVTTRKSRGPEASVLAQQERVANALFADSGEGSVSRHDDGLVGQRQHGAVQRLHDLIVRAARQVRASNRTRE